jgi:hypothetical protein
LQTYDDVVELKSEVEKDRKGNGAPDAGDYRLRLNMRQTGSVRRSWNGYLTLTFQRSRLIIWPEVKAAPESGS